MLAAQLDTVKVRGIIANVTIEDQLTEFMSQFRNHMNQQPALIDLNSEQIIRWDPIKKEKTFVSSEEFEREIQLDGKLDASLAVAEIFQAGYLELGSVVYCLVGRGLPTKYPAMTLKNFFAKFVKKPPILP